MNPTRRLLLKNSAALCTGLTLARSAHSAANALDSNASSECQGVLSHALRPLTGSKVAPLCDSHGGRVLLLVNTASKCGFTPQFESLEALYQRYRDQGFEVLGFPSGDFLQELADEQDVAEFCELNYGVSFPMYQKISVAGENAHPLYQDLAAAMSGFPRWNFYKYLVGRNGQVIERYNSTVQPLGDRLIRDIESLL